MHFIDPHIHIASRTTDDLAALARSGCVLVGEPSFWAGFDRTGAESFRDYFRQLTEWEPKRCANFGLRHYTWLGVNAIDRLISGYIKVKSVFPPVKPGDEWHTTCSGSMISAGTVFNRVPDRAEMVLDIRHTGTKASARALMRRIAAVSGLKVEALRLMPAMRSDERHPLLRELRRFMASRLKRRIALMRLNAATDARHFVVLNAPIAMLGTPYQNAHASNERAHLKGMFRFQHMLEELCGQGLPSLRPASSDLSSRFSSRPRVGQAIRNRRG